MSKHLQDVLISSERFDYSSSFEQLYGAVMAAKAAVDAGMHVSVDFEYVRGYCDEITPFMKIYVSRKETNEEYDARLRTEENRKNQARINEEIEERRLFERLKRKYNS